MSAKRLYSWEDWFDRGGTTLVRGVDYHCSQYAMVAQVRNAASKHGVKVRVADSGNTITIEVTGEVQYTDRATVAG